MHCADSITRSIGVVVKRKRLALQYTQKQLSEQAKININYISGIERGKRNASVQVLCLICHALNINFFDLMAEASKEQ